MQIKKPKKTEKIGVMQRITLAFFDRFKTTVSIWVSVAVFGVVSYTVLLQRQGFPDVSVPFGVVSAQYFVNDSSRVDADVAIPVSNAITTIDSVSSVQSISRENFVTFFVEYDETVTSETGNELVKESIDGLKLPDGAVVEYRAINASKFNDTYDILVSYSDSTVKDLAQLNRDASTFANNIAAQNSAFIGSVKALNQYSEATSPITGEKVTLQTSFDRFTQRKDGNTQTSPSVVIGIIAADGVDALGLSKEVQRLIADSSQYPTSTAAAEISADFAEGITAQVDTLEASLFEGFLIILVVGFVLISLRAGLVTALAMLTTLLITVGALYVGGLTLNTITLFGLILCLGLIVDDAIIMTEALDAARRSKASKRETASLVTKKVGLASLSGTLTTMLGFAPLLFVGGILGEFIRALPITIIISLAASLLTSLTLVPFLAKYLILGKATDETKNPIHNFERRMSKLLARRIRRAHSGTRQKVILIVSALALSFVTLAVSGVFFGKLKLDIFPSTKDSDALLITATYQQGVSIADAQVIAERTDNIVIDVLGENIRKATYSASGSDRGATIQIDLVSFKDREPTARQLAEQLEEALSGLETATFRVAQLDAGPPKDDYPYKMQIYGDGEGSALLAADIQKHLDAAEVERTNGTKAQVVRTQISRSDSVLRQDGKKYIELSAGFDDTDVTALTTATQTLVEAKFSDDLIRSYGVEPSDVAYDFGNESDNQDSFKGVLIAFPVLILVMYILLLVQFRSVTQPLLILAAIPFSLLGVSLGLYNTNNPLSFFVMVALFALVGVAVNNTILLTDYANQARRAGVGRIDAIASAVEQRFRPLVTTSLTSVIALVPLALSDPFWESLAVTLIFGLLSSTLLVILIYPYYYLLNEWLIVQLKRVVKTKRTQ